MEEADWLLVRTEDSDWLLLWFLEAADWLDFVFEAATLIIQLVAAEVDTLGEFAGCEFDTVEIFSILNTSANLSSGFLFVAGLLCPKLHDIHELRNTFL